MGLQGHYGAAAVGVDNPAPTAIYAFGALLVAAVVVLAPVRTLAAETDKDRAGTKAGHTVEEITEPPEEAGGGFWERENLTGNWGGVRDDLADRGIDLGFEYIGEFFSNVSGGIRRGTVYQGRFEAAAALDLEKIMGWNGATVFANAYQIHGRGLSAEYLGNLMPTSNIEADPATRLFDLWLQQDFWDGRASLRIGQLAADDEFVVSDTSANFLNGTFGWLALAANNLPNGGPAYPLAAPGVRLEAMPAENLTFRTAAFSGDPADRNGENPSGTTFSFHGGVFWISELQYDVALGESELPGSYKIGGWYHSGQFSDLRYDTTGMSLAAPGSNGMPAQHRGTYAIYGVADQTVWREPGTESQGLSLFTRVGAAPADVNPVDFYADAGVSYTGLVPCRDDDLLGLAAGYANVSSALQGLDEDTRSFSGVNTPVENYEIVIELLYSAEITPWWVLQPDFQYFVHPGGHVADPNDLTGQSVEPNAFVIGLRSTFTF